MLKPQIRCLLIALLVLGFIPFQAWAACDISGDPILVPADGSSTEVQLCVEAATSGDTIQLPSGTYAWTGYVSIGNKQIHIKGAGEGVTIITGTGTQKFRAVMTTAGTHAWRISNLTLNITNMGNIFTIHSGGITATTSGWRIDHITINNSGTASSPALYLHGETYGLIDHVTFNGNPFQVIALFGYLDLSGTEDVDCLPQCLGYNSWNRDLNLGTDEAIYMEDCTITFTGSPSTIADTFDLWYGGAVVFRYNTVTGAYMQTHSSKSDAYGGRKYEVYNNTFDGDTALRWGLIRSGTGVIFNNTVTGYSSDDIDIDGQREVTSCTSSSSPLLTCNGANSKDGNTEASGWPCLGAVGRGSVSGGAANGGTMANTPLYAWNNGTTSTCAEGGACDNASTLRLNSACGAALQDYLKTTGSTHGGGEVDYVNNGSTPKPGYTAYTYPHPLTNGDNDQPPDPQPPPSATGYYQANERPAADSRTVGPRTSAGARTAR